MQRVEDFVKAPKPRGFTSYHFTVMLCLMHSGKEVSLSHSTIGERTGMSRYTVRNVLQDLRSWKWISMRSGKRQYNTSTIEVQWGNLPQPKIVAPLVISQNAKILTEGFKNIWTDRCQVYRNKRGWRCKRPLPSNWKRRWEVAFQTHLNEGYTAAEMVKTLQQYEGTDKDPRLLLAGPQSEDLFPRKEVR